MNQLELDFARAAVESEHLGQGSQTDLLTVSLSANDYVGHAFGPYSLEVADATLRTDRYLADFFQQIDRLVGLNNVWIVLSADHGVAPEPRFSKKNHLGQGNLIPSRVEHAVEQALTSAFGPAPSGQWVQDADEFYVNLNPLILRKYKADRAKAQEVAAQAAASVPGVRAAFSRTQLLTGQLPLGSLSRKAAHSFNSERGGDVFLILDPFTLAAAGESGTSHGTPWSYDAQVPLIFWGQAFMTGTYRSAVEPIDLVPTIAAALDITQPSGAEGRPLTVMLK